MFYATHLPCTRYTWSRKASNPIYLYPRASSDLANPGHFCSRADVSFAAAIIPSGWPSLIWTPRRVPTRDSTATAPDCSWISRFTSDAAKSCRCRSRVPTSPRSRENRMLSNRAAPSNKVEQKEKKNEREKQEKKRVKNRTNVKNTTKRENQNNLETKNSVNTKQPRL